MAKKSVIERQKKREVIVKKYYLIRKYLKGKIYSALLLDEKLYYYEQLQKLPKDSSFTRMLCFLI